MSDLKGKAALVTGGSRGIGAAIARRLAADGAMVAITYGASAKNAQDIVASMRAEGGRAMAIAADSSDPAAVQGAVQRTTAEFGGLDILVNNAGMLFVAEIARFPDEQFERMLSVNVRAVFYASREAARQMRDGGRIINIGSVNSDVMPFPGGSIYAMTKGAIAGFTHGLARDLGPRDHREQYSAGTHRYGSQSGQWAERGRIETSHGIGAVRKA